jgi:hypothetical protein
MFDKSDIYQIFYVSSLEIRLVSEAQLDKYLLYGNLFRNNS